jgi:hypothetical protein
MNNMPARPGTGRWLVAVAGLIVFAGLATGAYWLYRQGIPSRPEPPPARVTSTGDITAEVHSFCGACHFYPPPETFPRSAWKDEVERGYRFFGQAGMPLQPPPIDAVVRYYEERAPVELPPAKIERASGPSPVRFNSTPIMGPPGTSPPAVSNVNLVHLFDERRLDVLACEMRWGLVMALKPYEKTPSWQILGKVPNPAHAEVVDLDGDGIKDIVVANLGSFLPTDRRCGSVEWLRGTKDGHFVCHTLLADVGRVADVQAADFRGVGKLDLIVACFGWNTVGEIIYLENQTEDWDHPKFLPHILDERHGAIHVPVADLNGDGRPDFVALLSQEHETVVAFLNEGGGKFRKETIFRGPHPAYGSSGIQLVDLNGDGNLDVLYTNGDTLDAPYLLKPYHGIQWLENPGKGKFPWIHHPITPMYGVHRAVAAEFVKKGRKDIAAVCFLPSDVFPQRDALGLDSILFLERKPQGGYARYSVETRACDHVTCVAGDIYGSGRPDLVTGTFTATKGLPSITIWRNLGPPERAGVGTQPAPSDDQRRRQ